MQWGPVHPIPFLLILPLLPWASARIVFPPHSDVGYIVADPPTDTPAIGGSAAPTRGVRELGDAVVDAAPSLVDARHGVRMGVSSVACDDAKTNLTLDWDSSPANYTCYTTYNRLPTSHPPPPSLERCAPPPPSYTPQHHCMNASIEYDMTPPTHGDHRPLWPVWGEYRFVPPQRWLHSIEHGAVVMLYHPCAAPHLVHRLRRLVRHCLYKHVITPYSALPASRPLALVAWGCVLLLGEVDEARVQQFIREKALHGPEGMYRKQGTFREGLLVPSEMPSGKSDEGMVLCGV